MSFCCSAIGGDRANPGASILHAARSAGGGDIGVMSTTRRLPLLHPIVPTYGGKERQPAGPTRSRWVMGVATNVVAGWVIQLEAIVADSSILATGTTRSHHHHRADANPSPKLSHEFMAQNTRSR